MIYLTEFATAQDYNAVKDNLPTPNVSLITDGSVVEYIKEEPTPPEPTPTHDYVEIGGLKWATMNIGANSVTDGGLYFQWGDTQGYTAAQVGSEDDGKKEFLCWDYKFSTEIDDECDTSWHKYNNADEISVLEATDDAVTAAWGGNWRTPSKSEYETLLNATTTAWTNNYESSGVKGVILTDKTDNTKKLFFPAIGMAHNGQIRYSDEVYYWTNELYLETLADFDNSWSFNAYSDKAYFYQHGIERYDGLLVRGVWVDN